MVRSWESQAILRSTAAGIDRTLVAKAVAGTMAVLQVETDTAAVEVRAVDIGMAVADSGVAVVEVAAGYGKAAEAADCSSEEMAASMRSRG
jgi:hypothetical protein